MPIADSSAANPDGSAGTATTTRTCEGCGNATPPEEIFEGYCSACIAEDFEELEGDGWEDSDEGEDAGPGGSAIA